MSDILCTTKTKHLSNAEYKEKIFGKVKQFGLQYVKNKSITKIEYIKIVDICTHKLLNKFELNDAKILFTVQQEVIHEMKRNISALKYIVNELS